MRAFRDQLSARGKRPKVVPTAVARKLLTIANAMNRSGRPRDASLAKSQLST